MGFPTELAKTEEDLSVSCSSIGFLYRLVLEPEAWCLIDENTDDIDRLMKEVCKYVARA